MEDEVSEAETAAAPCLLALAVTHLPFCLQGGRALYATGLLSLGICSILCSVSVPGVTVHHWSLSQESFFSFFVFLAISSFWLLSHISSLRLSSGQSGLILTLRTDDAAHACLPTPNSLIFDVSIWATSPSLLVFAVRCVFCGFYLFFFFSPGYVAL